MTGLRASMTDSQGGEGEKERWKQHTIWSACICTSFGWLEMSTSADQDGSGEETGTSSTTGSTVGGGSGSATSTVCTEEMELDIDQKACFAHHVRTEIWEKGFPIVNADTHAACPCLLEKAAAFAGIPRCHLLACKGSMKRVIGEKLNNCRSHLKKEGFKKFKGE